MRCRGRVVATAFMLIVVPFAWTQDATDSPDYERCQYEDDASQREATAGNQISCMIEIWKTRDATGTALLNNPNIVVVEGNETVGLHVEDRNWTKSRTLAYTKAYLNAMREFVGLRGQQRTVETQRRYFSDDSTSIFADDPTSYLERIAEKEAVLLEGRLDRALEDELGMSAAQIARLTFPEKIIRFRDDVLQRSLTEAFGSAAGLIPMRTFEAVDTQGNSAIGVVVVFSPRMARLATLISENRQILPDPGRARYPVRQWIDELSDEDLATLFGVRIWWDEQGYPVVVSFGQWGLSTKGLSNRQQDRSRIAARKQAENAARDNLAEFVDIATNFSDESFRGELMEQGSKIYSSGVGEDFEVAEIVDAMVEEAKTRSVVNLTGLGILRTWSARHPVGDQVLVGAIAYWSPAREDAVRRGLGQAARHASPEPESASDAEAEAKPVPSGRTQSKSLMDASDF